MKRHSKLLAKYIKINFFAIFLPVTVIGVIYCISVQKDYMEKYLDTIEYSVNEKMWKLEARMKSFASTAQRIYLDEDFTPYSLVNSAHTSVKQLKSFRAESNYFDELAIYLNDSNKVYTSSGVVDIGTFMDRTYKPEGEFTRDDFMEVLGARKLYGGTREGQYVTAGSFRYDIMTYPLGKSSGSFYGTLLGIYKSDWEEIFQTEIADKDKRLVVVCTDTMEMIYTLMPDRIRGNLDLKEDLEVPLAQVLKDWDKDGEYYEFSLKGTDYIGKVAHSGVNGWYMIDMVDKGSISRELIVIQLPMLVVVFFSLLFLTFFLSIVLSMYNYMPIQRLYSMFDKKEKRDKESGKDELLFLNEYIRELIEEQSNMEEQRDISMKMSRIDLVRRLLRGSLDATLPSVRALMADVGLCLNKKYMSAVVLKASKSGEQNFDRKLRHVLEESKYEGVYLTEKIYKDYDAFLVCVEKEEEIEKFVEWLIKQMGDEGLLRIGVGNVYSSVESLKYSLMEGIIAVEGKERNIIFFSDLTTRKNGEFYRKPLENELKLKQLLVAGGVENLDEVLNALYKELIHIQLSCSDTVLFFLMNRIIALLFEDALSLGEGERYLHYSNLDEFETRLREFCRVELNSRLEQRASQEDKRIQSIISFIDENYMNREMSLAMVAEKFDMTGPYLSRIFKAAMGKNFIEYITEKRLELAAQLLVNEDDTIGEIVGKVGYSDAASFTRKFTRYFMISPGSYRKAEREKRGQGSPGPQPAETDKVEVKKLD